MLSVGEVLQGFSLSLTCARRFCMSSEPPDVAVRLRDTEVSWDFLSGRLLEGEVEVLEGRLGPGGRVPGDNSSLWV